MPVSNDSQCTASSQVQPLDNKELMALSVAIYTPPMGYGFGYYLDDDPTTLVWLWRYGIVEADLVAELVEAGLGAEEDLRRQLDTTIQAHLASVVSDPAIKSIIMAKLTHSPLTDAAAAIYEDLLWQQVYLQPPKWENQRALWERNFLVRIRSIIL